MSGGNYATSSSEPTPNRCADLAVPSLGYDGLAAQIIADDKRWTLLRRCLPNETMDPRLRAAGRSCCATDNRPRTPWNSRATT